jgi:molybdenum cofactor guanylyltransferase
MTQFRRPGSTIDHGTGGGTRTFTPMEEFKDKITGVVIAGGQGRRMGGVDKGLVTLAGRPMVEHVIARLRPQVASLLINANRNLGSYEALGYPVVSDTVGDYFGPLAGFLAAMRAGRTPYILTAPCDTPLIVPDLARRLWQELEREEAEIAVAHDGQYLQPLFALIDVSLADSVEHYLDTGGRKIDRWYNTRRLATVDFSDVADSFTNVNNPEQRADIEALLVSDR